MAPTLHKPVPMGSRVYIPEYFSSKRKKLAGTVVGVASLHVIYTYIVLLDEPLASEEFGEVKAVVVNGPELEGIDGSNWRMLP